MIQLGLQRISRLIAYPTHHIHVAGTNGKGSICAYISAALTATGVRVGKFTSPHLIHRHDCITINDKPVALDHFQNATESIERRNEKEGVGATPFEILTATAFKIFNDLRCDATVIECGMGGLNDATNAYDRGFRRVTVISKVGLDHQEFLGNTIEEITKDKCGIFCPRTPVIFDESNSAAVLRVIRHEAWKADAYLRYPWDSCRFNTGPLPDDFVGDKVAAELSHNPLLSRTPWQLTNAEIAFRAAYTFLDEMQHHRPGFGTPEFMDETKRDSLLPEQPNAWILLDAIMKTQVPGRFQTVNLSSILGGLNRSIILDGAHNPQAIQALAPTLLDLRSKSHSGKMTWVVALSEGKNVQEMLAPIIRSGDFVAATQFGPVDGMPWKRAMPSHEIVDGLNALKNEGIDVRVEDFGDEIGSALSWATSVLGVPTIGIGSLYLVSDVLRLVKGS